METKGNFWWLKKKSNEAKVETDDVVNKNIEIPTLVERLSIDEENNEDVDIPSILEEISRLSAKSPLGPYEKDSANRSVDEIMREVEKLYLESSKSFEQLSQRSKTSQNVSEITSSSDSTPTPKSASPLPLDKSSESETESFLSDSEKTNGKMNSSGCKRVQSMQSIRSVKTENSLRKSSSMNVEKYSADFESASSKKSSGEAVKQIVSVQVHQIDSVINDNKEELIRNLTTDNKELREELNVLQKEMEETRVFLQEANLTLKNFKSSDLTGDLNEANEQVKVVKEQNAALEVQLNESNKTNQTLRVKFEDLVGSNQMLERRLIEFEKSMNKQKSDLLVCQEQKESVLKNEASIKKFLEIEKLQVKSLKMQTEKDAKCILDLNRQIKEMERIIARKHPDSVSALIVASKGEIDKSSSKKLLEDRIRSLEKEALLRDTQNSQVFIDVQEKFNQMKLKYENHIDDLELHVNDLKTQLKRKADTYDVYTQTPREDHKIYPQKDTTNAWVQTAEIKTRVAKKEIKEDSHLLATIRGLQTDLSNKEKVGVKLQKEIDELRKTNRRLQKEREGSLRNLYEKKEFRSFPEKLSNAVGQEIKLVESQTEEELRSVKVERDTMKQQLCRIEEDYQTLKAKRLHDLTALQDAHEREISTYLANITPLREQMDVQQVSLGALQQQLSVAKEELAVVTVERDHLHEKLRCRVALHPEGSDDDAEVTSLKRKISLLEQRYEEREHRLRAIVHGLAQKSVTNRSCEQCAARQQQLIGYKTELDQLIATLRSLQP